MTYKNTPPKLINNGVTIFYTHIVLLQALLQNRAG
jgi:hypothetical protein